MRLKLTASLLLATALAACPDKTPPTPTPEPTAAGSNVAMPAEATPSLVPHTLANMDPAGQARIDDTIRKREAEVAKLPKVDTWVTLGQAWVQKARETADPVYYLNADACAVEAMKLDPDSEQALELRVLLQLSNHQFALARANAQKGLAKRPDSPTMLGLLSDSQMDQGDYAGAHKSLQTMMDLKPDLPSYSRVAYLQWMKNDGESALKTVKLAYDSGDPKQPEALAWVLVQAAMIFWQNGDYKGADAGFDKALATFYDFPPALAGKGRVAMAQGDPKKAVEFLSKAFKLSPLMSTAWLLYDAQVAMNDTAAAAKTEALLLKNGKATDPRTYALFLAEHDLDHDNALKLASDERNNRDDVYTEDAYAWALFREGKLKEARAASDKAIILNTPDAMIWYHAGAIRIAQGQKAEGKKLVKKALDLNPFFDPTGRKDALVLLGRTKP